jgi:oxygen-dependent protoporphyrinogen oxidase
MKNTIIIGGGIAGLATAFHLQEDGYTKFTLVESAPRVGGKISSTEQNGFLIEGGPDSFITQKKSTLDLCKKLGLEQQFIGSQAGATYVWSSGRLHPMPEGMMLMAPTMIAPIVRSRLISWPGKLRLALEPFIQRRTDGEDESLASFVRRRLGTEMLDKIAGPLMGGIHAADAERLSIRSTFPIFPEMERKHGSLTRAMMNAPKRTSAAGANKPPMFTTLRSGLDQLTEAIAARLPASSVRLNARVVAVHLEGSGYDVVLSDGSVLHAGNVVFATPSYITADLVQQVDPLLANRLRTIRYVSTATVSLGFRRSDIQHPVQGAGFIVPRTEGRRITACSWSSAKFAHRAPDHSVLLRAFIGGALAEDLAELHDSSLLELAWEELHTIMGITADPVVSYVARWRKSSPQYDVGHEKRIAAIEQSIARLPGIQLAGNAYHGSGIPDCIVSGQKAAQSILFRLAQSQPEFATS